MKRKAFAISGALLLGLVAIFTLVSLLKAAAGLAVIFFAGRGLMRLWIGGGRAMQGGHYLNRHEAYPGLGNGAQHYPAQSLQPMWGSAPQQSGIIPIW